MNSPFNMPDEYVQGFFKAGQNLLQALTPLHSRPNEVAAPARGAPLAELQLNYFQQQFALPCREIDRRFNNHVTHQISVRAGARAEAADVDRGSCCTLFGQWCSGSWSKSAAARGGP